MIIGHGGNIHQVAAQLGCAPGDIIDMSSNVNPLGPPPGLLDHLKRQLEGINALPEADAAGPIRAFATRHGIGPEQVAAGNGTTQLIYALPSALGFKTAMIVGPTYADYADACALHGTAFRFFLTRVKEGFRADLAAIARQAEGVDGVFICNPNNPTGNLIAGKDLAGLVEACPGTVFIVDESYLPFAPDSHRHSLIRHRAPNLVVLNSMSKIFRVPGLRIGFAVAKPEIRDKIAALVPPWSVNSLAQTAVSYLMARSAEMDRFVAGTVRFLEGEKQRLCQALDPLPKLRAYPSTTSFVLAELNGDLDAQRVYDHCLIQKFLIRNCKNFKGLSDRFVRISLKDTDTNTRLAQTLAEL